MSSFSDNLTLSLRVTGWIGDKWQYQPSFKQQYVQNGKSKRYVRYFQRHFFGRVFNKLLNNTQVDCIYTYASLVIDV